VAGLSGLSELTDFAQFILSEMAQTYSVYALSNKAALADSERQQLMAVLQAVQLEETCAD